jgi:2'-5' RNA ligase
MREDLQKLVDHLPEGLPKAMFIQERLRVRVEEAKLDPEDYDLNPHLQLVRIADQVIADVLAEEFERCSREEVYLLWLTNQLFPNHRA